MSFPGGDSSLNDDVVNPGATGRDVGGVCQVTEERFAVAKGFGGLWVWIGKTRVTRENKDEKSGS